MEEIPLLNEKVTTFLENYNLNPNTIFHINLALEETITNIIKYSYYDKDNHEINIEILCYSNKLEVLIKDDGNEFNFVDFVNPELEKPLDKRKPGGLGIHIVKNIIDEYYYSTENGINIIKLVKYINN